MRVTKLGLASSLMLFLTLILGLVLTSSYSKAEGNNRNGGEGENACNLSYSLDDNHSTTIMIGIYMSNIGTSTFNVVCNDNAGFSVYAVGFSNDEYGNNKMSATIGGVLDSEHDIITGTAINGDTSNWAMKINAVSGTYAPTIENNFNDYSLIPSTYSKIASFAAETDDTVGSSLQSAYAVYISPTQPEGTYTGKVKYTLVHPYNETPCTEGKICYHKNANNVVGSMGRQNATGTTAMLMASNFSHDGYGFAGWNTEEGGTGTSYGPNETITLPSDMSEGLNLYAMWVKSTGSLQDWDGCYNMNIGDVTALTDMRDNDTYAIAKLADGKCWMIENLRLDNTNSDNATGALAQGYGTSATFGNFSGLADSEAPWIADSTTANSLYSIDGSDGTINIGVDNDPARRFPRYNNQNTASRDSYPTTNQNTYSYGNYYTWAAAIADLNPNNTNNQITTGTSLCPTGWRLPSGGAAYASDSATGVNVTGDTATYRDFYNLGYKIMDEIKTAYEDTVGSDGAYYSDNTTNLAGDTATKAFRKYPNNFVLSGYVYNGSINNRNSYGLYWSSTARNTDYAYRLYMNNSVVYPSTAGGNKFYGRSVRCVTNPTQRHEVTVNFDDGVSEVSLQSDNFGKYIVTTSGSMVKLAEGVTYTISGTYSADDRGFDNWATTSNGVLGDATSRETTYTISDDATLTLTSKEVCPSGKICYKRNDTVTGTLEGTMGRQNVGASSTATTLWASNYSNSEYGFAGWNTEPDGSGISYGPNETITYESGTYNSPNYGLLLYANWVESEGSLQGWNRCSALSVGDVTALTDRRDNQVYAVAKLVDGNCWMIENLRLEYGSTRGATNQALAQGYGGVFTGLAEPETDSFDNVNTPNSLYTTDTTSTTLNIITGDGVNFRIPRYRNDYTSNRVSEMTSGSDAVYSYGNYYNFAAAIANTDVVRDANQSADSTSICPTGWRLPKGGDKNNETNNEFWALVVDGLNNGTLPTNYAGETTPYYTTDGAEVSKKVRKYPNNFVLSGASWGGSETGNRGSSGFYWTSTVGSSSYAYTFMVHQGGDVHPGTYNINKWNGRSVRCVYNDTSLDGFGYMQDFAELTASEMDALKASMTEGEQYTIVDSRDNKVYYISKLADGNIWMTQNLDYDIVNGGADIDSTNTDVPEDWADGGNLVDTSTSSTWENRVFVPRSYDPGDNCWNGTVSTATTTTYSEMVTTCTDYHYHLGNYYNWTAATAMADSSNYATDDLNAEQSICPAGWTLPRSGSNTGPGSFDYLVNQANLTEGPSGNLHTSPYYFVYGGQRGVRDWLMVGINASYWSSATFDVDGSYSLAFNSSGVLNPKGVGSRDYGDFVRCIVKTSTKTIDDLEYMQDFATLSADEKTEVLDSMTQDTQYQLTDSRDDKVYYVSKLADGNVWMTQNLDFDIVNGGAGLDSTNTDVPANWADGGNLTNTYASNDYTWDPYTYNSPESYDPGDVCWDGLIMGNYSGGSIANNTVNCTDYHYHIGNYYNWSMAIATSDSSGYTTFDEVVEQSICPAGWTLPKSGFHTESGSFNYLYDQVTLTDGLYGNVHLDPYYYVYNGHYSGNTGPSYIGSEGSYWSSTVSDGYNAYITAFGDYDDAVPATSLLHSVGTSVRCIAR